MYIYEMMIQRTIGAFLGSRSAGKIIRDKYSDLEKIEFAYQQMADYWNRKMSKLQITTPNEGRNTLINTWPVEAKLINYMLIFIIIIGGVYKVLTSDKNL